MSDLNTWYRTTEPWIAAAAHPKYGHPVSDRELLDRLSPLLRAHAVTAPLLLVHGLNDTNVPPSTIRPLVDALTGAGTTGPGLQTLTGLDHDLNTAGTPANGAPVDPAFLTALRDWAKPYASTP